MILGHWYLVVLDLPIVALRRLTRAAGRRRWPRGR